MLHVAEPVLRVVEPVLRVAEPVLRHLHHLFCMYENLPPDDSLDNARVPLNDEPASQPVSPALPAAVPVLRAAAQLHYVHLLTSPQFHLQRP